MTHLSRACKLTRACDTQTMNFSEKIKKLKNSKSTKKLAHHSIFRSPSRCRGDVEHAFEFRLRRPVLPLFDLRVELFPRTLLPLDLALSQDDVIVCQLPVLDTVVQQLLGGLQLLLGGLHLVVVTHEAQTQAPVVQGLGVGPLDAPAPALVHGTVASHLGKVIIELLVSKID